MRVLLVNKFHYLKGGSEKYYFELGQLLKENGHEVAYFSMKDEKNIATGDKEYFVEPIDLNGGNKLKALDVIYSRNNYKKMLEAIDDFKPDIIHLNNFQRQLSASIVKAAYKRKIPMVFTAHDLQAVCPGITMLDNNKNICEKCMRGKYYNCIKKKCNKNSLLKSIIGALEGYYYRFNNIYTKKISCIITPSEFYRKKLIEDGIKHDKIKALHNFINLNDYEIETINGDYALYLGRLSEEKGILNLISAFSNLNVGKLYIAGDGPEKDIINEMIKNKNLEDKIKMLGFLKPDAVKEAIRNSRFVVVPSIWYENCPYSVMETLTIGKPIIGADIAGIPELVKKEYSGLIYKYDDINELASKMLYLFDNEEIAKQYGKNAKEQAVLEYGKEKYYKNILKIYNDVIKKV